MQGHEFLKTIHDADLDAVSVLVTGYSDMDDLIHAVNEGHIYAYVNKPWEANELKLLVEKATEHYRLRLMNNQLTENWQQTNQELQAMNEELEQRVTQRTEELNQKKSTRDSFYLSHHWFASNCIQQLPVNYQ